MNWENIRVSKISFNWEALTQNHSLQRKIKPPWISKHAIQFNLMTLKMTSRQFYDIRGTKIINFGVHLAGTSCSNIGSSIQVISIKVFFGWDEPFNSRHWINQIILYNMGGSHLISLWIYPSRSRRDFASKLFRIWWNSSLGLSPAYWLTLQTLDLPSHHSCLSQFFKINDSAYTICWFSFCGGCSLTQELKGKHVVCRH